METTKKLIMSFLTSDDRKVSLSVDNPREDITETEIKSAMDLVVEKNIFNTSIYSTYILFKFWVVSFWTERYF